MVWDHAAFPKGKAVGEGEPPYAPESYGAGIGGVRRCVEGRRHERIEAKKATLEAVL